MYFTLNFNFIFTVRIKFYICSQTWSKYYAVMFSHICLLIIPYILQSNLILYFQANIVKCIFYMQLCLVIPVLSWYILQSRLILYLQTNMVKMYVPCFLHLTWYSILIININKSLEFYILQCYACSQIWSDCIVQYFFLLLWFVCYTRDFSSNTRLLLDILYEEFIYKCLEHTGPGRKVEWWFFHFKNQKWYKYFDRILERA